MSGYRRREEWRQQRKGRMRGSVVGDTVSSFSLCCIMIAVCHDTAKHTEIVDLQMGSRVCKWGFYGVRSSTTARYVCQPSQQAAVVYCRLSFQLFTPYSVFPSSSTTFCSIVALLLSPHHSQGVFFFFLFAVKIVQLDVYVLIYLSSSTPKFNLYLDVTEITMHND